MNPVVRMILRINMQMLKLRWTFLAMLVFVHFAFSWYLLLQAGETEIIAPFKFYYFYLVTASTVGYGDFSPSSLAGQAAVSLFVIPGGVILFAALIGKMTTVIVDGWRRNMKGQLNFNGRLEDHIVIMGWHRESTARMIDLIFGDTRRENRDIVLVSNHKMENPDPDRLHFVQAESLASEDVWERAAIADASRIIIAGISDESTLTTALSLSAAGRTNAHIVCHFEQADKAALLKAHAPQVECHISTTTEMLVRSAQDPGSSRVQAQLLNTLTGPTQFSFQVPSHFSGCTFGQLIRTLKEHHDILVLGLAESIHGDDLVLNPPAEHPVHSGHLVYYMAHQRLRASEINWGKLLEHA